jgi:hypothetical protein
MQLISSLRKWMTGRLQTRRAPARKPTPRFLPQLERLERRDVPSTLTVTNNLDSGAGSLRAEIAAAQPGDTIVFAPNKKPEIITLTSGLLDLNKNLSIQGPGAGQLTISGDYKSAAFKVESQTQVTLSGLTISNGNGGTTGGGAIDNGGTLTVSGCTITQNQAQDGGGILNASTLTLSDCNITDNVAGNGGGIFNYGTLTLSDSTLSGNTAQGDPNYGFGCGGGIYNEFYGGTLTASGCTFYHNEADSAGGGVFDSNAGTATLTNCTLCNNLAFGSNADGNSGGGGGVFIRMGSTVNLINCTLSLNAAQYGYGGGIEVLGGGAFPSILNLTNTIVAQNTAGSGPDIYGAVTTADHNLVGGATGSSGIVNGVNGNIVGGNGNPVINAELGPLQNNGGPTQTMALLAGSLAIGHADNSEAPATDQRGVTRLDEAGETTDIGAFELSTTLAHHTHE